MDEESVDKILTELSTNRLTFGWVQTFADSLDISNFEKMLGSAYDLGQALCGLFALVYVCRIVWRSWANGSQIDLYKVLKPCGVGMAIFFFSYMAAAVDLVTDALGMATQQFKDNCSEQSSQQFKSVIGFVQETDMTEEGNKNGGIGQQENQNTIPETKKLEEKSDDGSILDKLRELVEKVDKFGGIIRQAIKEGFRSILVLASSIVCCCILCMGFIGKCIFYFIGPILFAMELIPGMEGRIVGWLKKYMTYSLYPCLINLVSGILSLLMVHLTDAVANFDWACKTMRVEQMGNIQVAITFIAVFMFMSIPSVASQIMETASNGLGGSGMIPVSFAAGKAGDSIAKKIGSGAAASATGGASKVVETAAKVGSGMGNMSKQPSSGSNFNG